MTGYPPYLQTAAPQVQPEPAPAGRFIVPRMRCTLVVGLLAIQGLLELVSLYVAFSIVGVVDAAQSGQPVPQDQANALDAASSNVALGQAVLYLITVILFSCWFYRVVANAKVLNPSEGPSPGWAVGSFFVPFICLVKPVQAAAYAWRTSARVAYPEPAVPPGLGLIGMWWLVWLISNFLGQVMFRMALGHGSEPTLDQVRTTQYAEIFSAIVGAGLAVLCALVVHRLTGMQQMVWDRHTRGQFHAQNPQNAAAVARVA